MIKTVLVCLLLTLSAFAQQPSRTFELGAEWYTTREYTTPENTTWNAYGWVYPAGTFDRGEGLPLCTLPRVSPIGSYAVYVRQGDSAEHVATYRITIGGKSWLWEGVVRPFAEDGGAPGALLYPAARLIRGVPSLADGGATVVFTPRSAKCFGGKVQLFTWE